MLAMNIMARGFVSDPNQPGAEKVVVSMCNAKWLTEAPMRVSSVEIGADPLLLPPQAAFAAKGWNRSVGLLLALLSCFELGDTILKA